MRLLKYLLLFACFIPLFIFRDFTPNNELKYLSIADEALRNGHLFTFWNHGVTYADKPPLYLWIIMAGKGLLQTHSMFFIGLFSILPALVILYIMDKWISKTVSRELRHTIQFMLMTSGLFIGSAVVLRMDMLMCMFIILSLYTFFKIYSGNYRKTDKIVLPIYIFMAVFTKGPVGILVPLLSIFSFLLIKGEIRYFSRYLDWKTFIILLGLSAAWFCAVFIEGGKSYLNNLLFNQTVNRAIDAFHHKEPVWYYLKTIWYSLAPWSLFYIVILIIGIRKKVIKTDIEKFFLTVIVSTFIALSIFSGKLDIYMLPIFPFLAYLSILILPKINEKGIYFTIALPTILLALAFPTLFIAGNYTEFPIFHYPLIPIAIFILSGTSILALVFLFRKKLCRAANSLSAGLLLAILIGSFTIPIFNKNIGFGEITKKAKQITKESEFQNYFFYSFRSGENMDAYLQQNVKRVEIGELKEITNIPDFILFIYNRDIKEDTTLREFINNKKTYTIGDYSIITN